MATLEAAKLTADKEDVCKSATLRVEVVASVSTELVSALSLVILAEEVAALDCTDELLVELTAADSLGTSTVKS